MNKNVFNTIELRTPRSNYFDLTHDFKFTCDMGELIPILVLDTVPGDSFSISGDSLIRFAPLIAPVMHRMDVTMHYFFVPNRLLWDDWETFITGSNLAGVSEGPTPAHPTIGLSATSYGLYDLPDYMGLPDPGTEEYQVNALPFAAYQLIYNEYYRDQNLIEPVDTSLLPGGNAAIGYFNLRFRAWEHDYFTASLPFAQKGASIDIPLGDLTLDPNWSSVGTPYWAKPSMGVAEAGEISQQTVPQTIIDSAGNPGEALAYDPAGTLVLPSASINDLRRAFRLQEWLEKNARGGTRYTESILVHFGVKSSDARLQRPEYITGTKSPVVISEVLNTTGTEELPQGNMAGHGISVSGGKAGRYFCEEHGWIIGIMSVMPKTAYQQGIPRMYSRADRFDYFWPEFANIGEQAVLNKEIYAPGPDGNDTFGYVPRYSEYKYMPSRVAGDFKTSLDFWHLGQIYTAPPALNQNFVEAHPTKRIFAVTSPDVDSLYCHVLNRIKANRRMPKFGTPMF